MTEDIKISVIIPAYNIENEITATAQSVLAQTHSNIELIIVNDGSKDNTGAVIDALAEADSRVIALHKENGGVTSARLFGVQRATGDYVGFVDGDDYVEPEMYARLLTNAVENNADISHCGYQMVFPNGRVDYYHNTGKLCIHDRQAALVEVIRGTMIEPCLCNKLFRKDFIAQFILDNPMDSDIKINEDLLMNYYLFQKADRSVFEDVCPYHYMLRKGSAATSRVNIHKLQDPVKVARIIYNDAKGEAQLYSVATHRLARQLMALATRSAKADPALIKPCRKEARKEFRQNIREFLRCSSASKKERLMFLTTAISPQLYGFVHGIYAKVSGKDRKYHI